MQFAGDPLINAIYQGIKRDIQVTYDNECYRACLILIYCGIDTMAYLDMPIDHEEVHRSDFIQWVEEYLSPNLKNSATQVTGKELYIARCAVVHTYGVESLRTKSGNARAIGVLLTNLQILLLSKTSESVFKARLVNLLMINLLDWSLRLPISWVSSQTKR